MESRAGYCVDTQKLSSKMSEKCLNIRQLALISGISRTTISGVLKGRKPSGATISGIAYALEMTVQEVNDIFFTPKITQHVNFGEGIK